MKIKPILTREEMQAVDLCSIEEIGISGLALMECAARGAYDEIRKRIPSGKVLFVVESGNNGGDTLALARMMQNDEYDVLVYFMDEIHHHSESFDIQLAIAKELDIPFTDKLPDQEQFDIIIDGIFGVGLSKEIVGIHRLIIERLNQMKGYKVAMDIPSGLDATLGIRQGKVFLADLTITFGYLKQGLILYPGVTYAGEIVVKDIGFPEKALTKAGYSAYTIEEFPKEEYPGRTADSHKGSYGKVLVVAGSKGMSGAAYLSAKAAYISGCGLVKIFTHESNRVVLQTLLPEAIVVTYEHEKQAANLLEEELSFADAILVGSGLGRDDTALALVEKVLKHATVPVVCDGDALYHMGHYPEWLEGATEPVVVTPHIKEMSYLTGWSIEDIKEDLVTAAKTFIKKENQVCVLKDARTIVADSLYPAYINCKGNHGMAVGGSGDILAGFITGLLGQKKKPYQAAMLGVTLHAMGGDKARAHKGAASMLASDILDGIVETLGGMDDGEL